MDAASTPLVAVRDLRVMLPTGAKSEIEAVHHVDLVVADGERVGLVGESGSGKSVTGRAIAGLLPTSPRVRVARVHHALDAARCAVRACVHTATPNQRCRIAALACASSSTVHRCAHRY